MIRTDLLKEAKTQTVDRLQFWRKYFVKNWKHKPFRVGVVFTTFIVLLLSVAMIILLGIRPFAFMAVAGCLILGAVCSLIYVIWENRIEKWEKDI
jgi:hypothetical protein